MIFPKLNGNKGTVFLSRCSLSGNAIYRSFIFFSWWFLGYSRVCVKHRDTFASDAIESRLLELLFRRSTLPLRSFLSPSRVTSTTSTLFGIVVAVLFASRSQKKGGFLLKDSLTRAWPATQNERRGSRLKTNTLPAPRAERGGNCLISSRYVTLLEYEWRSRRLSVRRSRSCPFDLSFISRINDWFNIRFNFGCKQIASFFMHKSFGFLVAVTNRCPASRSRTFTSLFLSLSVGRYAAKYVVAACN